MNYQDTFNEYYKTVHGIPFYMDAKEAKNLKLLMAKIKRFWFDKEQIELDEDENVEGLKHFLNTIEDEFTLDQLTPSMINSRFNILASQAYSKREKKTTTIKFKVEAPTQQHLEEIQQIKRAYEKQKQN